jgi:N-hydroxyarylamine O-acetyltransferase
MTNGLPEATTEAVLDRMGLDERPAPDRAGLDAIYAAWCERVPFDNLIKRIHLAGGSTAPIPNGQAEPFWNLYLRHGAGGTCWPSSNALHALLVSLGFSTRRGSAAMYDDRTGPIHTHGTEIVTLDGDDYWVDSSMLTRVALPLRRGADTQIPREFERVRAEPVEDLWRVWWQDTVHGTPIGCLLLADDVDEAHYLARYEASRAASPFNEYVCATRVTPTSKVMIAKDIRYERDADGLQQRELGDDRVKILVEEFGYSEEIVTKLPPDSLAT